MSADPFDFPLPTEPYRGIRPFRLLDWRIFFERDLEAEQIANLVTLYRGVLLYGQSGSGKSSLINAGLLPAMLRRGRVPQRIRVFPEHGHELFIEPIFVAENRGIRLEKTIELPAEAAPASPFDRVRLSCDEFVNMLHSQANLGPALLIFDQFEELVTLFERASEKEAEVKDAFAAREAIEAMICERLLGDPSLPVKLLFAFRDDYFARLVPLFSRVPGLLDHAVGLSLPRIESVHRIIRGPFTLASERGVPPGHFRNDQGEPDKLDEAVAKKFVEGLRAARPSGIANLSEVQVLCYTLWHRPQLRTDLANATDPASVLQKILVMAASGSLNDFSPFDKVRAAVLLSNLVTEAGTRDVVSEENLIGETRRNPLMWFIRGNLRKVLDQLLSSTHLLRQSKTKENTYYEVASEFLISWIQKQQQRFRRLALIIWGYVFAGVLLLLVFTIYEAHRAKKATQAAKAARKEATATKNDSDKMLSFMQYDLSETFRKLGRLDMMEEINDLIRRHFEDFPPGVGDLDAIRTRAVAILLHSDLLLKEGHLHEVLEEAQKALKVFLWLGEHNKLDYQLDIALGYEKVGWVLRAQGNTSGALENYHESLKLREALAISNAGDDEAQRDLSVIYDRIGDVQNLQGDLSGALKSYRDSLVIAEELARKDPDDANRQRDLSISYSNIGDVQGAQGDLTNALKSYRASLVIREKLAKEDPGNSDWQRDLSANYNNIGDIQSTQGDLPGAMKSYRDGLAIREKFAREDPDNADWQFNLSFSYNNVGDIQSIQGDLPGAFESYRDCLAIREKLAKQDPGNADWQLHLSIGYSNIGDVQSAQGDLANALQSYRVSLVIREKLARQDPGNADWQRVLSFSYNNVGDVQSAQGDLTGALKSYRDCQVILEKLVKQNSSNADCTRELAINYSHIGDILRDQKDFDGALKNYREGLAIIEKLRQHDSNNFRWQSDLSDRYADIGKVLCAQGDLAGALKNYRDSLGIREKLAIRDPTNAGWQAGLGWIYWQTGAVLGKVQPGSKEEGFAMVGKGNDILRDLKKRNALTAEQQKWLVEIEAELGTVKKRDSG